MERVPPEISTKTRETSCTSWSWNSVLTNAQFWSLRQCPEHFHWTCSSSIKVQIVTSSRIYHDQFDFFRCHLRLRACCSSRHRRVCLPVSNSFCANHDCLWQSRHQSWGYLEKSPDQLARSHEASSLGRCSASRLPWPPGWLAHPPLQLHAGARLQMLKFHDHLLEPLCPKKNNVPPGLFSIL